MVWNTRYCSQIHFEHFDIYQLDQCQCHNKQIISVRKPLRVKVWIMKMWRCPILFGFDSFLRIQFQLLKLITIIKNSEKGRLSKELPDEKDIVRLPIHMKQFFLPAKAINPSKFKGRRGKSRRLERQFCYTHTMILNGHCVIMCDTTIIKPC